MMSVSAADTCIEKSAMNGRTLRRLVRPADLVRLKYMPWWTGLVMAVDDVVLDHALVAHGVPRGSVMIWIPLDLLELVPGPTEVMVA